ncbi:ATP-binding protein [Colwellia sp. E2M01]|uniref:sensor histidine kinase n=1 Tax=Colwellia sp. E2M01 TaxID=2841561 RepID=UPI001C085837|nr:ATP-binding protein [Colwellia sp. E2M01]MBU2870242.1 sensor histidine kinase [Colwellia sp. E2M01]
MRRSEHSVSLHNRLVRSIMALTTIIILTASAAIFYMVDKQGTHIIADDTHAWANLLASNSAQYLHSDNGQVKLKNQLKKLVTTPLINHIHVYRINQDESIEYFSSYNRNHNFPPIRDRISDISRLSSIQHYTNHLELIVNITQAQKTIGYLFIQTSLLEKQTFLNRLVYVMLVFFLFALILSFYVARSLFNNINQPIDGIIDELAQISRSRNYQTQLTQLPFKELDTLTVNINVLLLRVEKHINSLIEEHQHTQAKNQALENRLSARTDALKESNQELLSTLEKLHEFQGQLVETEKMASLGDMVAGIAHEVNTPIGLGVTASSLLADNLAEIKAAFENKTLRSSQLKKFLNDGDENIALTLRNLERAAHLISSFKKVAVDQSSAESRNFNVRDLIDEVLLTLSAKIETANIEVAIDCPEDLLITSKPGPINQILINLILNSLFHGFDGRESGHITINIINLSGQLHINYRDDGVGIDNAMKIKIFDPFTTTKRGSGGSGLGMHLVYNLVTQALAGHIALEDDHTPGVSFDISFPVALAAG